MILIPGISLIGLSQAFALTCVSNVAGNWNDPNTWTDCGGGVPDDTGDIADIEPGGDVKLNNDFEVLFAQIFAGGSLTVNAKLTSGLLGVNGDSQGLGVGQLFINCNGEVTMSDTGESSSNNGLLTNHGILQTFDGVFFFNTGTYRSSGTDIFAGTFSGNPIQPISSICAVGGELIPLDTTMVLAAGAQYTAAWMIPVIVSGIGIAIVIARKF